eukprot:TRINITY_DN2606_c0_g1_i4.p1 TRINITY_DN2606_c0_g1~~TRINITY_DN2606_c0_g1_i4.p1  ORF type:complete len:726 (-),score=79.54 TRINITY_DN2606_c0_g1_i4:469-2541(-)
MTQTMEQLRPKHTGCCKGSMQQRIEHEVKEMFRAFRWKKYGNKEIKGGPLCRGYYFCRTCGLKLKIDYVKQVGSFGEEVNIIKKWELEDPKCHLPECTDSSNRPNILDSSDCSGVNNFQLLVDAAVDAYQGLDDSHRQSDYEGDQLDLHSLEKSKSPQQQQFTCLYCQPYMCGPHQVGPTTQCLENNASPARFDSVTGSCQTHSTIPEVEPRSEPPNTQLAARQAAEALIKGPLSISSPSVSFSLRKRRKHYDPPLFLEMYEDSDYEVDDYRTRSDNLYEEDIEQDDNIDDDIEEEVQDGDDDDIELTDSDEKLDDLDSDEYEPPRFVHGSRTLNHRQRYTNSQSSKISQERLILRQFYNNERRTVHILKENLKHYEALEEYGYRKYGQKDIQGSIYPRSYHRCNRESCPARKQVQQIDSSTYQINYLYQHDHQPLDQSARHRRNKRARNLTKNSRRKQQHLTPRKKQTPTQQYRHFSQHRFPQTQFRRGVQKQTTEQVQSYCGLPLHFQDRLLHNAMQMANSPYSHQGMVMNSPVRHPDPFASQASPNSTLHQPSTLNTYSTNDRQEQDVQQKDASLIFQLWKEGSISQQQLYPFLRMASFPWASEPNQFDLTATLGCNIEGDGVYPNACYQQMTPTFREVETIKRELDHVADDRLQSKLGLMVANKDLLHQAREQTWEDREQFGRMSN